MSHDKIKTAARQRMARTGESYAVARAAVIREYQQAQQRTRLLEEARSRAYENLAVELARYGQEVRAQLAYASGLDEIQRRFAAQVAESLNAPAARMAAQVAESLNAPAARMAAEFGEITQHFAPFRRQLRD
jgi:hypothetical protein